MSKFVIIFFCFYSMPSFAVFQQVWKGYQVSKIYQIQKIDLKIIEEDFSFQDDIFDWKFNLKPAHSESNPASLFSFQSQKTVTDTLSFGFSKTSYKFGTFSITQDKVKYDISKWNQTSLNNYSATDLYENRISLNYSYDFLDRTNDLNYELMKTNYESQSLESKLKMEEGYLEFFTTYLQAKYQVFAVELTKSFVAKAQKRVNLIRKRIKDGLSLKVELLQAKSSLANQQESLEKSKSELKTNLAILENILGFKIEDKYFSKLNWIYKSNKYWLSEIKEEDHLSVDVIKRKIEYAKKQLDKVKQENGYKLILETSYATNALATTDSKSLSEAYKRNNTQESISLNLVIPLGMDKRESLKKKYAYQKIRNELELNNVLDEIKIKKSALKEQISFLEKAYDLAKEKVKLAEDTLVEQNKLYLRGQVSFDDIIRTEESYINTELNHKRTLLDYEILVANYAYLNNGLYQLLNKYQD